MSHQEALSLVSILDAAHYPTRLVGGCVRDMLMKIPPKDFDLATTALPADVRSILEPHGYKVIPTGIQHGTLTVVATERSYEITTLRQDVKTDGRHAEVKFGTSFPQDAARRDFTINAMSMDAQGKVYDYFQGEEHLRSHKLYFVGDPRKRIQEDYLRILRFFRFQARFKFDTNQETENAILECKQGLTNLSQERITSELRHILSTPNPSDALSGMLRMQVWQYILPELDLAPYQSNWLLGVRELDNLPETERFTARLALAMLLEDQTTGTNWADTKILKFAKHHKLSNQELFRLQALVLKNPPRFTTPDRAFFMDWIDSIEKKTGDHFFATVWTPLWGVGQGMLLGSGPSAEAYRTLCRVEQDFADLRKSPVPVSGDDILASIPGITQKQVGHFLAEAKRLYRNAEAHDKAQILSKLLQAEP